MAGITSTGFEVKRLGPIQQDRFNSARNYFGSNIDTSENSVMGRALRVGSPAEADLWELAEAVFNSFNPDFAEGVSLDRVVAYAGYTRHAAAPSKATLLVTGDYLSKVPQASLISSSATSNRFLTDTPVIFDNENVSAFTFTPIVVEEAVYSVNIGPEVYSYTAVAGDTLATIATGLRDSISSNQRYIASVVNDDDVQVDLADINLPVTATISSNLAFRKISKIVTSSSEEAGPISQPAGTLDTIGTPVIGWTSVTNPVAAAEGRFRETDSELRARFKNSKELNARGTVGAIYSNLRDLVGVEDVEVYENYTMFDDVNGLPPKSFTAVVVGGNSQDIGDTIWNTKPTGIESYGNTPVTVFDRVGLPHTVSFTRPVLVDVYIEITISQSEGGTIAANTESLIKEALIAYFEANYSVGDNVIYSRLYGPITSAEGYQVDSLTIGTDPAAMGTSNISMGVTDIASLLRQNITINTTV